MSRRNLQSDKVTWQPQKDDLGFITAELDGKKCTVDVYKLTVPDDISSTASFNFEPAIREKGAVFAGWNENPDVNKRRFPKLTPGSRLAVINDTPVQDASIDTIQDRLLDTPKPHRLTFWKNQRNVMHALDYITGEIGCQQARNHRDVVAQMQKIRDLEDEIVERIKFREQCEVEEAKARALREARQKAIMETRRRKALILGSAAIDTNTETAEERRNRIRKRRKGFIADDKLSRLQTAIKEENASIQAKVKAMIRFEEMLKPGVSLPSILYVDLTGSSLLHHAAKQDNPTCIHKLLDFRLSAVKPDFNGEAPIVVAIARGLDRVVDLFADRAPHSIVTFDDLDRSALHVASRYGRTDMLRRLLDKLITRSNDPEPLTYSELVNRPDGHGWTCLHHAALQKNVDTVKFLLDDKVGARTYARSTQNKMALDIAEHINTRNLLKEHMTATDMQLVRQAPFDVKQTGQVLSCFWIGRISGCSRDWAVAHRIDAVVAIVSSDSKPVGDNGDTAPDGNTTSNAAPALASSTAIVPSGALPRSRPDTLAWVSAYNQQQAALHPAAPHMPVDAVSPNALQLVIRHAPNGNSMQAFKQLARGFQQANAVIGRTLAAKGNVLICCDSESYSCSSTVMAAYLMIVEKMRKKAALELIQERCRRACPNSAFLEGLLDIDDRVQRQELSVLRKRYRIQMLNGEHEPPRAFAPL